MSASTLGPSLEAAAANVRGAGLDKRITIRTQGIRTLDEVKAYDCTWLPTFFVTEAGVEAATRRVFQARAAGRLAGARAHGATPRPTGKPVLERARLALAFLAGGHRDGEVMLENHWRAVDDLMLRLGLAQAVRDSVRQTFARWDGKGVPRGLGGEDILIPSRLVNLADVVEMFHRMAGVDAALTVAAQRAGTQFDPAVVEAFSGEAAALFAELDGVNCWDAVMTANPASDTRLTDDELDNVLEGFADFVDVKSPYTIGHIMTDGQS